jgi:hypothetical protein
MIFEVEEETGLEDDEDNEEVVWIWNRPESPVGSLMYEYEGDSQIHDPIDPSFSPLYCIIVL